MKVFNICNLFVSRILVFEIGLEGTIMLSLFVDLFLLVSKQIHGTNLVIDFEQRPFLLRFFFLRFLLDSLCTIVLVNTTIAMLLVVILFVYYFMDVSCSKNIIYNCWYLEGRGLRREWYFSDFVLQKLPKKKGTTLLHLEFLAKHIFWNK